MKRLSLVVFSLVLSISFLTNNASAENRYSNDNMNRYNPTPVTNPAATDDDDDTDWGWLGLLGLAGLLGLRRRDRDDRK